jgi:hypothetical protein
LMLMLCRVEAAPDIGSISIWHLRCSLFPPWCPTKALLISGRMGDLQPQLLAEHRQSFTGEYHAKRGTDRDQRAALGSGVLSAALEPATDRCSVVLDAGLAPKRARQSPSHCVVRTRVGGRGLSSGPGDYGVRRARVGTHRRLQGLKPRLVVSPVEAAHYCKTKLHKR